MTLAFPMTLYDVVVNNRKELDDIVNLYLPIDLLADLYADDIAPSLLLHLIQEAGYSAEPVIDWLADYFDPGPEYND